MKTPAPLLPSLGEKNAALHLSGALLALVFCLLAWSALVAASAGRSATPTSDAIAAWYAIKDEDISQLDSPKLVVAGGSSSFYGARADILAACVGLPTFNYGTHAALPLDYLLEKIKQIAKPGDIVLLIPEYEYFEAGKPINAIWVNYALNRDPDYLKRMPLIQKMRLALATPMDALMRTFAFDESAAARQQNRLNERERQRINQNGDFTAALLADRPPAKAQAAVYDPQNDFIAGRTSSFALGSIPNFLDWAESRQVCVIIGFPFVRDDPSLHTAEARANQRRLIEALRELTPHVAGAPADFFVPPADLYDTKYHLHSEAAKRWSHKLCRNLEDVKR